MAAASTHPSTLVLHAVRLLGFADVGRLARRYGLDPDETGRWLGQAQASGWVEHADFGGAAGWSLTEAGRRHNEALLAAELDGLGARARVLDVHRRFLPLNARLQDAATRWQVRPLPGEALAVNDHTDHRWDDRVIDALASLGRQLVPLELELASVLARFDGYADRFEHALEQVLRGQRQWVDGLGIDSCHAVWMQWHEDLLATLGLARGDES